MKVNSEDNLPKLICQKCLNTILSFYMFKTKVLQNDLMLRRILKIEKINNSTVVKQPTTSNSSYDIIKEKVFVKNKTPHLKIDNKPKLLEQQSSESENIKIGDYLDSEDFEDGKSLEHVNINKKKTHQCDVCGKIVNSRSNLNQHYRKHTGERPFACDACGKRFIRAEHVIIHKRTHTGMAIASFKCNSRGLNTYLWF